MATRRASLFLAILLVASAWSAFAQTTAKPVTLTFWAGSAYYNSDEAKKPQSEWAITKIVQQFEAQNPGVKVDVTPIDLTSETIAKFKAAAIAKNGPDVIELWTGSYLFPLKDILLPLNKYIPADDKK
ncbi:MAG: extracellular solute-binding protein, partial [bacterium]